MGCGCPVGSSETTMEATPVKTTRKVNKVWIILGAVVVLLGVIAAILFMPRDIEMDDIKETNMVTAILRYGIPLDVRTNDDGEQYLAYDEKVTFYGYTPWVFSVHPEEDTVVMFFEDKVARDVYYKIERYCELEENLLNSFHVFSYGNLEITTYDYDGSYVRIEIN